MAWENTWVRNRTARHLSAALDDVVGPVASSRRSPLERLRLAWPAVCGPLVARHAEVVDLRNGLLHIEVRGRHWREAIYQERADLARRLRPYHRGLIRLHLVSAPVDSSPTEAPSPRPPPAADLPDDPRTAEIRDPKMRRAIDRLLDAARR